MGQQITAIVNINIIIIIITASNENYSIKFTVVTIDILSYLQPVS